MGPTHQLLSLLAVMMMHIVGLGYESRTVSSISPTAGPVDWEEVVAKVAILELTYPPAIV